MIFDLLEAEDVRFGTPLMYNEPAGPYTGVRAKLDYPQLRGLGAGSLRSRGAYHILSGQEYRTGTYGHLNLFLRDDLVREGESYNADNWPPYGAVGRETQQKGGIAIYAHGGYAQSIYADFVRGDVNAVELLQFGVYRGIELDDWYHILNIGYRFPIVGASDYPACRKLADCVTYVRREPGKAQDFAGWLRGAVEGRGFVTTGPILLLEVEGQGPGAALAKTGPGPHTVAFRARAFSAVTPFSELQIVVNGRVVQKLAPPGGMKQEAWYDLTGTIPLEGPSWVAARAFGKAADGSPDAEAHTNPVYVHVDGKAPYDRGSLDHLVGKLDGLMAKTRARSFPEKAKVLDRFQGSRDLLLKVRAAGGLPASGLPPDWVAEVDQARFDPSAREHTDAELAAFLKPVPPRTPTEAAEAVESAGGFRLTPVAAEPLVRSPVAAAFDEDGNLYVAEMTDYPYKPRPGGTPLGSIRLLRDTDGDGTFDKADVFADGLLWAAGVLPWKGGVFVTAPPDIWYMKDTDGDHKADVRRKVFTGFGVGNEQGMLNNLTFGLDHKVYGSTSVNGGSVRHADRPDAAAVSVDGKDFRFDPVTEAFEPISGTVQFGTTFDDWGDRFLCSESQPLLHAVLPLDALARNPYLPVASALKSVAGSPVPIQRISPPERWRQIRSSRRIAHGERSADSAGASHHVVDAAAGVTIYRGSAYPAEYYGDAFVCDAQNNLIHRMNLLPDGPTFRAERADPKGEFVRSYDTWFRPVNLINAPDGTLYVLDMSREVIEAIHIPNDVVKHLDLRRGRDQGRIYRIAPPGFTPKAPPRLGTAATTELVAALGHPDGWWRDTAHRLIFERQDAAAVEPLRALLRDGPKPVARVHALWSLQGLKALTDADLLAALADPSPRVVEQAVKLAEARLDGAPRSSTWCSAWRGRTTPACGSSWRWPSGRRPTPAQPMPWRRSSAATAATIGPAWRSSRHPPRWPTGSSRRSPPTGTSPPGMTDERSSIRWPGSSGRGTGRGRSRVPSTRSGRATRPRRRRLVVALGRGMARSGGRLDAGSPTVAAILRRAESEARAEGVPDAARAEAVAVLGLGPYARARGTLADLLDAGTPGVVQAATLRALAGYPEPEVAGLVLARLRQFTPVARAEAIATLLAREPWTLALLKAVKAGTADPAGIDPSRRALLVAHRNPEIAALAKSLFGDPAASPARDMLAAFAPALAKPGDPARGSAVFERLCQSLPPRRRPRPRRRARPHRHPVRRARGAAVPHPRPEPVRRPEPRAVRRRRQDRAGLHRPDRLGDRLQPDPPPRRRGRGYDPPRPDRRDGEHRQVAHARRLRLPVDPRRGVRPRRLPPEVAHLRPGAGRPARHRHPARADRAGGAETLRRRCRVRPT